MSVGDSESENMYKENDNLFNLKSSLDSSTQISHRNKKAEQDSSNIHSLFKPKANAVKSPLFVPNEAPEYSNFNNTSTCTEATNNKPKTYVTSKNYLSHLFDFGVR